jgi:uncharacterized protein (DUF488 family)
MARGSQCCATRFPLTMREQPHLLLTVGHSSHPLDEFLRLLADHHVAAIADVRSWPKSRYAPWFDRESLSAALRDAGIAYVFLGRELGGRPRDAALYDGAGRVRYDQVARTPSFTRGLQRLLDGARQMRVAAMCAEEDPLACHRRLLVARVALQHGVRVEHIRGDGRSEVEPGFALEPGLQLFDQGEQPWTSTRSVSRKALPSASSAA